MRPYLTLTLKLNAQKKRFIKRNYYRIHLVRYANGDTTFEFANNLMSWLTPVPTPVPKLSYKDGVKMWQKCDMIMKLVRMVC